MLKLILNLSFFSMKRCNRFLGWGMAGWMSFCFEIHISCSSRFIPLQSIDSLLKWMVVVTHVFSLCHTPLQSSGCEDTVYPLRCDAMHSGRNSVCSP
jgi:hypothetical protein